MAVEPTRPTVTAFQVQRPQPGGASAGRRRTDDDRGSHSFRRVDNHAVDICTVDDGKPAATSRLTIAPENMTITQTTSGTPAHRQTVLGSEAFQKA